MLVIGRLWSSGVMKTSYDPGIFRSLWKSQKLGQWQVVAVTESSLICTMSIGVSSDTSFFSWERLAWCAIGLHDFSYSLGLENRGITCICREIEYRWYLPIQSMESRHSKDQRKSSMGFVGCKTISVAVWGQAVTNFIIHYSGLLIATSCIMRLIGLHATAI